jgi:hypothetical protein
MALERKGCGLPVVTGDQVGVRLPLLVRLADRGGGRPALGAFEGGGPHFGPLRLRHAGKLAGLPLVRRRRQFRLNNC